MGAGRHQQRVSVGWRLGGDIRAYGAAGPRAVIDDDSRAQHLVQLLAHGPRYDVVGAAGRIRDDDAYRFRGIRLRIDECRRGGGEH